LAAVRANGRPLYDVTLYRVKRPYESHAAWDYHSAVGAPPASEAFLPMPPAPDVNADSVTIQVDGAHTVSGLVQRPSGAFACLVLAHGAGAGMTHRFMQATADGLARRDVATLRFQFPYMEAGSKRPDRPALAHATVRAAVAQAAELRLNVFAGGKSFGGRMTSQAQAESPLPGVLGLVFLGFPLHPANKPADDRAQHLAAVRISMLFVQGTRDALADAGLMVPIVDRLGASLYQIEGADHSFHVPARSGTTDAEVLDRALDRVAAWMRIICDRGCVASSA
jgi:predicted alpha/beta-hydrolase family hydrolase